MAVKLIHDISIKRYKNLPAGIGLGLYPDENKYLVTRLPLARVCRLFARSVLLALFILSLPRLGSIFYNGRSLITSLEKTNGVASINNAPQVFELVPMLFHDLKNEGLLKPEDKAILLSNNNEEISRSQILENFNEVQQISIADLEKQSSISSETLDFFFTQNFPLTEKFIDRTTKIGAIVAVDLADPISSPFQKPSNYKTVYLRLIGARTVLAMRKTGKALPANSHSRRLCGSPSEAKKAALNNLEDVLLEPPRSASRKSNRYLKRTRFLPDLMDDSLESYPRRVFIDVGLSEKDGGSGTGWFGKNYPTRNKNFEMYKIETLLTAEDQSSLVEKEVQQIEMSDWLRKNVREEEYVVMKAEAEVVEEVMRSKAIRLVDELFLECKPQGKAGNNKNNSNKSRRAYWECLALYGQLRDEGVAVHQWWG